MICVKLEDLKPGMILAKSVRNRQGLLLLGIGTKISKKNIRIFKSWGVHEIFIKGAVNKTQTEDGSPAGSVEDTVTMELKKKFSDVLDDPVMVEIFKATRKQLKKDLPDNEHEK